MQRADDPRPLASLADLAALSQRKPVLISRGSALARRLAAADVAFTEVGSEREALQMLALGRADAVYGQDINLQRHGRCRDGRQAQDRPHVFQEESPYLTVRADLPAAQENASRRRCAGWSATARCAN
jgi:ABC-type amino acid transport substrate-binding protein